MQTGAFLVNCSKGTYVRTLCDDIGKKLGCGAVLTDLQRTKNCKFGITDSITLENATHFAKNNTLIEHILPCDTALKNYNKINISALQSTRFKNGGSLSLDRISTKKILSDNEIIRVYSNESDFIGLGKINFKKNELTVECLVEI